MTRWFFKSCETKYYEERNAFFRELASLDRRISPCLGRCNGRLGGGRCHP